MTQAVIQIGNSIGVVIPQRLQTDLKAGDKVVVDKKGDTILISPVKKVEAGGVDAKFMKLADEFIAEHEDVLRALANK
jgi:putative addiction module antidote